MLQGGVSSDHEIMRVVDQAVETDGAYHEAYEEAGSAYEYRRVDGTVERAASAAEAIAKCDVLRQMAAENPDHANALLELAAVPDKPLAIDEGQPKKDAKTESPTEPKPFANKTEHIDLVAADESMGQTLQVPAIIPVHPNQADSNHLQPEIALLLHEAEVLREVHIAQDKSGVGALSEPTSAPSAETSTDQLQPSTMGHVIVESKPFEVAQLIRSVDGIVSQTTHDTHMAEKPASQQSTPVMPKSVEADRSVRRQKSIQAEIPLLTPVPIPTSNASTLVEAADIELDPPIPASTLAEEKNPEPIAVEISDEATATMPEVSTGPWYVPAPAEYDDELAAMTAWPALAELANPMEGAKDDLAAWARQGERVMSSENNVVLRQENDFMFGADFEAAIEIHLEHLGPTQAETARELVGDLALMIKERHQLPEVAVEEREALGQVIAQLGTQLLACVGEDHDEESVKQFMAEITQITLTDDVEANDRHYDERYLNRIGTHEYRALDQSSVLGSLAGFIKQKLQLHLELARYTLQACLA